MRKIYWTYLLALGGFLCSSHGDAQAQTALPMYVGPNTPVYIGNGASMAVAGDLTVAGTNSFTSNAGGTLSLPGSGGQKLTGIIGVGNLNIPNAGNTIDIPASSSLEVSGALSFGGNNITVDDNSMVTFTSSGTHDDSGNIIGGSVKKIGMGQFTFPLAKSSGTSPSRRVKIGASTSATHEMTVKYYVGQSMGVNLATTGGVLLSSVSVCEYWELTESGGNTRTISLEAVENGCALGTVTNLRLARYDATKMEWEGVASTYNAPFIDSDAPISTFSPWTIGSTESSTLPLGLLSFSAQPGTDNVKLLWVTSSSRADGNSFELSRSSTLDGDWEMLKAVETSSNTDYTHVDFGAKEGTNYYRLEELNPDGVVIDSRIASADMKLVAEFLLYPNPTKGGLTIKSNLRTEQLYSLLAYDPSGRLVVNEEITLSSGKDHNLLINDFAAGQYTFVLLSGDRQVKMGKILLE